MEPQISNTLEKGAPFVHENSTIEVSPRLSMRSAFRHISATVQSSSGLYKNRVSDFHLFTFPTIHFHLHLSVTSNIVTYSSGRTGSRQNISMWAPVSRWK